jgi:L-fuculose-phosphate aldolase
VPARSHRLQREAVVAAGRLLEDLGLLSQTAGNISVRLDGERLAITPSSMPYGEIEPDDVVVADLDGRVLEGERRPSSELPFHAAVYRGRPDLGGVVHTHSPYATTLAVLGTPLPAIHYAIASLEVHEVPVVPYATPGSDELARHVEAAFAGGTRAALLANHGALTAGPTLASAVNGTQTLELLAALYHRAVSIGTPVVLPREEIERVRERYRAAERTTAAA